MNRAPFDKLGKSQEERDFDDNTRRSRNCALGIIVVLMMGYLGLVLIGGPV